MKYSNARFQIIWTIVAILSINSLSNSQEVVDNFLATYYESPNVLTYEIDPELAESFLLFNGDFVDVWFSLPYFTQLGGDAQYVTPVLVIETIDGTVISNSGDDGFSSLTDQGNPDPWQISDVSWSANSNLQTVNSGLFDIDYFGGWSFFSQSTPEIDFDPVLIELFEGRIKSVKLKFIALNAELDVTQDTYLLVD